MVGEWDDGGTDPQNHGGMDLAVRVCLAVGGVRVVSVMRQVVDVHGNHRGLLFLCVYVPGTGAAPMRNGIGCHAMLAVGKQDAGCYEKDREHFAT